MAAGRIISVIGLGYVGLPVATAFAAAGSTVIGYDRDKTRIAELRRGHDRTREVDPARLTAPGLVLTDNPDDLARADFHIVTVPTPINGANRPDLGPLLSASEAVGKRLRPGAIVVFESTVYPGATEEDCLPVLEKASGLIGGRDFTVGYSPERINPGDPVHRFETIVKVVAGQDQKSLDIIAAVYGAVVTAGVHKAPSIAVAEAAKVLENTQRDVNIALMNELSLICHRLGIDTHDVLEAARTKWNFLGFYPGLVGGHCIGVDPYYLTHRAEQLGYHPEVILAGRRINDGMGRFVAHETIKRLARADLGRRPVVTLLGLTFKEDVPDLRNTRAGDIIGEMRDFGAEVQVHDPMVAAADAEHELGVTPVDLDVLRPADAVLLTAPHRVFIEAGWPLITRLLIGGKGLVVDVKARLHRAGCPDGVTLWRL